ncbi:MAG: arsenate reductase ArsC [Bacteroidota bacterium]|nr:arsenate reductase ArsC [Bacteroidota bacterium]
MYKILVLCTGNSCRSQMAEGLLNKFLKDEAEVYSAGTHPEKVNPYAIRVMNEEGIDISNNISNNVEEYKNLYFDFVITVCNNAKESCPVFLNSKTSLHHSFSDPAMAQGEEQEVLSVYRKVRDELKEYLILFCKKHLH